jgi:hypothetical protein
MRRFRRPRLSMNASYRLGAVSLIAALGVIFILASEVQAQELRSILRQLDELAAEINRLKEAIADKDIVLSGAGKHGEIVKLPQGYGNTDKYFFFISVPGAGIPSDSVYADNGFSGFQGSVVPLPDKTGWMLYAVSADNLKAGASGGMANVSPRNDIDIHYLVLRKR